MKRLRFLFLALLLPWYCFADEVPYALFVENSHWVYDALHILSVEQRQVTLADRQPLSKGELAEYFSALNPEKFRQPDYGLYTALNDYFHQDSFLVKRKILAFDVNGIFNLQAHYAYRPENEVRTDRFLRYNKTPPVISVPLQVMFTPHVNFFADIALKKNYWAVEESYPYTNVPLEANGFDAHFPLKAGITFGGSFCNLTIGRGALNIGRSLAGSMLLADTVDRMDYITASFFTKNVRLSVNVLELEPTRFVFAHEAVFRPIEWIAIRFYEGVILNTHFDPKYLNPMMIFHNYYGWRESSFNKSSVASKHNDALIGCQFAVTFDIVPMRGLRLYAQYGQNQFQTQYEKSNYETAENTPNSLGGLCGIEYIHPFYFGHLSVTGEFLYANPWMYIMENKNISLYHRRRDMVAPNGKYDEYIKTWVANPYGPDTMGCFLQASLLQPKRYAVECGYRFLVKGENEAHFFDKDREVIEGVYYPNVAQHSHLTNAKTPSANPVYFHTLSAEYNHTILPNLECNTGLRWTIVHGNKTGHAVDCSASLKYAIR